MRPEQIRKAVEEYPELIANKEKIQKRIINLSGRDPEQEAILFQRLEYLERTTDLIDYCTDDNSILTNRESHIVYRRAEGCSYKEIGSAFPITHEAVRQILNRAYKKMSQFSEVAHV